MLLSRFTTRIPLEERAVFPLVEESLSEAALTELAARPEVKEAGPRGPWVEPWVPAEELSYAPWPGPRVYPHPRGHFSAPRPHLIISNCVYI